MSRVPQWIRGGPAVVFLVALAFRALFLLEVRADPFFSILAIDASSYHDLALRFAGGDLWFGREPLWFAPLYPVLLGTLYTLFGPEPFLARALQLLLGAVTAALGAHLGGRISRRAGWGAGLALALSPVLVSYENQLLYTSLAVFLTAAFLAALLSAGDSPRPVRSIGAGLLLGGLGLVRSNALLFLPFAVWLLVRRRGVRHGAAFALAAAVALSPVLLRNGLVAGTWAPMTVNGGMIFATGFAEDSRGGRALLRTPTDFGPRGAWHREAEREVGRSLTLGEAADHHRDEALARIRERPGWALGLTVRKFLLLLNAREIEDNLGFPLLRERARTLAAWPAPWAWFLVLGAVGAAAAVFVPGRRLREARVHGLFLVVYGASLLPFFITARYRLPLVVPLAVLGAFGLDAVVSAIREPRGRRLIALGACAAVAMWGALRAPGVRASPALEWVAVATGLERAGRHEDALAAINRALALDASVPGAHHDRALTLHSLGRDEEALPSAREATRLDPDLFEAWLTEGAILASLGRIEEALPRFRRAVELRPGHRGAQENLARALALTEKAPRP